ncbi:hypothetical protein [Xenophilus sp.]|uniref:hypothetical protein n=1 Tax=Xenophilus sp. TaxID=1873499 RepID=UPI0037DC48FE
MTDPLHLTIRRFQNRAEALDEQGSTRGLDDAIADLAAWMDVALVKLDDVDRAALIDIGGLLYREGLRRIMGE